MIEFYHQQNCIASWFINLMAWWDGQFCFFLYPSIGYETMENWKMKKAIIRVNINIPFINVFTEKDKTKCNFFTCRKRWNRKIKLYFFAEILHTTTMMQLIFLILRPNLSWMCKTFQINYDLNEEFNLILMHEWKILNASQND